MSGRVAIVTGAARGIGAGVAERLAADGMAVALFDLLDAAGTARAIEGHGGVALPLVVDVRDAARVAEAVSQVADELGPPTVVVNNAGTIRDNLLFKMSTEDWEDVMATHLTGAFHLVKETQRFMVEQRHGRIVNLSSVAALGNRGQVNYSAAKAGIQGFTKTLAIELGPFGVTANAIAPGFIETDMTRATAARMGMDFEQLREIGIANIPVRRIGQPEDAGHLASFLVSDGAGFVSGQVIYLAGGPERLL